MAAILTNVVFLSIVVILYIVVIYLFFDTVSHAVYSEVVGSST
jgi:hypothetical protein